MRVTVVGAGLAGSEAAWQIANRGVAVDLYEMRPQKNTPAHTSPYFAELVCSNSLRAANIENAVGLLKEEMRRQNSLIMQSADKNKLPAGSALAVDRENFAKDITKALHDHPLVEVIQGEVTQVPRGITVIAAGPLASDALVQAILAETGQDTLHFHDAVAPIVEEESINKNIVFAASRFEKGDGADYLNCPMNEEEYWAFYDALRKAEVQPLHDFEDEKVFEGCMPVEAMAKRGEHTLRYGPLKPVGLIDPRTGKRPYAVVQLRQDNAAASHYNLVGFQTRLKWGEQKKVFSMIPGLENAEFVRFGVMHRNTYLNSPSLLKQDWSWQKRGDLFFAGQITGVEGYMESAASGLMAGINAARLAQGQETLFWPADTACGSLIRYITFPNRNFQPANITFGLMPPFGEKIRDKKQKNYQIAMRALSSLELFLQQAAEKKGD